MKIYQIINSKGEDVLWINAYKKEEIKRLEDYFDKDIETINAELKEKNSITKDGEEYEVALMFID